MEPARLREELTARLAESRRPHVERITVSAASVSEALRASGLEATLVGGGAVEFYDPGAYTTSDIDLVVERARPIAQLERYDEEDATLNALVIGSLLDLDTGEAAPLIERAFAGDAVDLGVNGDREDVQVELGLLPERLTPRPPLHPWLMPRAPLARPAPVRAPVAPSKSAAKAGARRKAAKRSRKRNRRGR